MMIAPAASPLEQIRSRQTRAGIIGLGYVGLPFAAELARLRAPQAVDLARRSGPSHASVVEEA